MNFQDLKAIEQKQDNTNLTPVNHTNTSLPGDSKLKSELTLLQRKYNRLEQKEKRIQVIPPILSIFFTIIFFFFLQQLCREWETNHDYHKFYKQLSAIAFSSGTKLKTITTVVSKFPIDHFSSMS